MHWGKKIIELQRQREDTAMDLDRILQMAEKQIRKVLGMEDPGMLC